MTRQLSIALLILAAFASLARAQSTLDALERALAGAVKERDALVAAREAKVEDASLLATEIDVAKRSARSPHAGGDLQDLLRRFDRLVKELDRQHSQIEAVKRRIERLRTAFDRTAAEEAARLPSGGDPARRLVTFGDIEAARRRIEALDPKGTGFRPIVNVTIQPTDLPVDIGRKIALVEAERVRIGQHLAGFDRELAVIGTRLSLTRQLLADLRESSAPSAELALLGREADTLADVRRELERQQRTLEEQRALLVQADDELRQRVADFKRRVGQLAARPGGQ